MTWYLDIGARLYGPDPVNGGTVVTSHLGAPDWGGRRYETALIDGDGDVVRVWRSTTPDRARAVHGRMIREANDDGR